MKRLLALISLLLALQPATVEGQQRVAHVSHPCRIHRTAAVPYETRQDADSGDRSKSSYVKEFAPTLMAEGEPRIYTTEVEFPFTWMDGVVYLHMENTGGAYSLWVNDKEVITVSDPVTPADIELTSHIREGVNSVRVMMLSELPTRRIDPSNVTPRTPFSGSYLYYQNRRSIVDFDVALVPDTAGRDFGMLDLKIVARNAYNYEEPVSVGYDIYSPAGKLLDFNIREVRVAGRSTDTVRFSPYIYHTYDTPWMASGKNPPLYKLMLFTRRNGVYKEYMPLKIGFGRTEIVDGKPVRLGKELTLVKAVYNAAADIATTRRELTALRAEGKNTICPDYPQPAWFYALCDELGLYVIDRAAISAPEARSNRRVGGTPSNDPTLVDEYIERVKAMYYRSRNFTCIVAYSLGAPSGNGYNMYKAYEWLKSVEKHRPVIYEDAAGEWNSDL